MVNCFYNKFYINILAIILALLVVFGISFLFNKFIDKGEIYQKMFINKENNIDKSSYKIEENKINENKTDKSNNEIKINENNNGENAVVKDNEEKLKQENKITNETSNSVILKKINEDEILYNKKWYLEIDKINLIAEIKEGTEENILDDYIGHFSNTPVNVGNVGLAAHNRGYKNNYFSRLKELKIGDKINYYIDGHKFEYEVVEILIIYETDWSMLNSTKDNRITMITCVENREKYRLCVQAQRIKEE